MKRDNNNAKNSRSRTLTLMLALAMVLTLGVTGLTACKTNGPADGKETPADTETALPTEEPTPTEAPTPVPWSVDEQGRRLAGSDTTVVRDGTPKKYFTMSFDDGITQDQHLIEIFNKYNFKGVTFFINTGLFGANWTWVGQTLGMPSLTHKRWTKAQFQTGIYDGFDVACHTVNHGSLKNYDEAGVINEVQQNADDIYELTGIYPLGMAWPGGDTEYTNKTVDIVSNQTTICFSRGVSGTNKFTLPKYWLKWMPTTTFGDGKTALTLAKKFLKAEAESDMLFYVWGHGYELDFYDSWDELDELIKMITEAEDVVIVTNSEFYWLFKDEIPKWK